MNIVLDLEKLLKENDKYEEFKIILLTKESNIKKEIYKFKGNFANTKKR